jgi:type IV pilus assembly protein PilW
MRIRNPPSRHPAQRQKGYTLLEILIALFIGIFLLVGLFTILQNTRRSSSNQTALAQLQDEERMAMSLLSDVIQNAGYFDPNVTSAPAALPVLPAGSIPTGVAMGSSQGLSGSDNGAGDLIVARYYTNGTDGIINCNGAAATGAATTYLNTFFINASTVNGITTYSLSCTLDQNLSDGIPLVMGVENMQIYYGVSTTAGANNVDTYMTATQVQASAGGWPNVTSVRVTLTFLNPLYGQAGYTLAANKYVYLTRVIPLQGRTGVIATAL